jgi:hypothetical protein
VDVEMSVDLRVWTSEEVDLKEALPFDTWSEFPDGHLEYATKNYKAFAFPGSRVFVEDVPAEVNALVPGIAWVVELGLEGGTSAAEKTLTTIALAVARSGHGVIEDPQEGTVRVPSGVRRYLKSPKEDRIDVLVLAWWTPGGPLLHRSGIEALISTIEARLPEAMPSRWGLHEPPNHSFSEEGTSGLAGFLDENRNNLLVTIPRRPTVGLDFCPMSEWGENLRQGRFEVPYLNIVLEAQLLDQPGWGRHLSTAFTAFSRVIMPFYGEARILRGVSLSRGHIDPSSPQHPVYRNWWSGIPVSAPMAAVLGPPYLELWPDFAHTAQNGLAFRGSDTWTRDQSGIEWVVPEGLTQEFDVHWAPLHGEHGGFSLEYYRERSTMWPFSESQAFEPPTRFR